MTRARPGRPHPGTERPASPAVRGLSPASRYRPSRVVWFGAHRAAHLCPDLRTPSINIQVVGGDGTIKASKGPVGRQRKRDCGRCEPPCLSDPAITLDTRQAWCLRRFHLRRPVPPAGHELCAVPPFCLFLPPVSTTYWVVIVRPDTPPSVRQTAPSPLSVPAWVAWNTNTYRTDGVRPYPGNGRNGV